MDWETGGLERLDQILASLRKDFDDLQARTTNSTRTQQATQDGLDTEMTDLSEQMGKTGRKVLDNERSIERVRDHLQVMEDVILQVRLGHMLTRFILTPIRSGVLVRSAYLLAANWTTHATTSPRALNYSSN